MAQDQYDYIVVGAGSAGCCMANRLSANPDNRVLLLEAGGRDTNPLIHMPIGFTMLMYSPRDTNLYKTEPEPFLDDRVLPVPRGRVLGGCSSINGMIYMRGQREDYDEWAKMPGCDGWSYEELLPYFKRSEDYHPRDLKAADVERDAKYHGEGGELNVTYPTMKYPITEAYLEAAQSVGIPRNDDLNGEVQEGIGYMQVNQKNGRRWSSAAAFLNPDVRARPNLTIATHAWAEKILIQGDRAEGIQYLQKNKRKRAYATREVVLTAGCYNSPVLLEMSGIGDPEVVKGLGLDLVKALPGVGKNLQDHYQLWVQHGVKTNETLGDDGKWYNVPKAIFKFHAKRTGPLTFPAASIGAFVPSKDGGRPIFQIHFTPGAGGMDEKGNMVASPESGVNSTVCTVRPTSRGEVHAKSLDPRDAPSILHNFLGTEHDRKLAIEGFKLQRQIYAAEPFQKHATRELVPGDHVQTDEEILDFWKTEGMSVYHPVGSAKMGAAEDDMAVVDNECRVHGIGRLRIVDASVLPMLPSGNTHAPVVAIAERTADLILGNELLPAIAAE